MIKFLQVDEVMKPEANSDNEIDEDVVQVDHLNPVKVEEITKKDVGGIDLQSVKKRLGKVDKHDRQLERERIKRKHKETKMKEKRERQAASDVVCILIILIEHSSHFFISYC